MDTIVLLEKLYGPEEESARKAFQRSLLSFTSGIEADAKVSGKTERNWIQVDVSGADSTIVANYLRLRFGLAFAALEDVPRYAELKGKVVDSGKVGYGVYVDIGISFPELMDVLVPLHTLRSQLADGRKLSAYRIVDAFCLHDNFPLEIRLTKVDLEKREAEAALSVKQVETFREWVSLGLDRVIAFGACLETIKHALRRSGVARDVIKVDQLGLLEYSLLCKLGTEAPGIVKKLGRFLPKIPLHVFSPKSGGWK